MVFPKFFSIDEGIFTKRGFAKEDIHVFLCVALAAVRWLYILYVLDEICDRINAYHCDAT